MAETVVKPIYPKVRVKLTGKDGNAFAVMGKVRKAMKRANIPTAAIQRYTGKAMSGDYDHLLRVTMETVTVK